MDELAEWALEGGPEGIQVGADGERTRYPAGVHDCVWMKVGMLSI